MRTKSGLRMYFMLDKKINFYFTLILGFVNTISTIAQENITETDGDWCAYYVNLKNTSQADQMIRYGDIDNLGFGFNGVDPFTGVSNHPYPWVRDTTDVLGMDMMIVSDGLRSTDGYSRVAKKSLQEEFGKTNFAISFPIDLDTSLKIETIVLQIYFDDVQSRLNYVKYKAYINDRRANFMERIINTLDQGGPRGKLISFEVPEKYFHEFTKSNFKFHLENIREDYCEGYAIDFIKILYNPTEIPTNDEEKTLDSLQAQKVDSIQMANKAQLMSAKEHYQNQFFEKIIFWIAGALSNNGGGVPMPKSLPSGGLKSAVKPNIWIIDGIFVP